MLKAKEVDLLVQNKELYGDKEQLSQQEYIKGISAWNFNLEDIKNQAALIKEYDEISNLEEPKTSNQQNGINDNYSDAKSQDTADEIVNLESSFASFPTPSLQALKGCFDICEDDVATVSPTEQPPVQLSMKASDQETDKDNDIKHLGRIKSLQKTSIPGPRKYMSGSLLPDNVSSPKKLMSNGESDLHQLKFQVERSSSGPIQHIQRNSLTNSLSGAWVNIFPLRRRCLNHRCCLNNRS
ncbi:hypothetical protein HanXRQr2_Chr09g0405891 [Helianthus annuus]|uniref:Uncharacterized protein n=1 Tax=Helianthus annuus TaxID=4232 RepID=A0A9K3I8J3_HELAN|nr:hypothetical protein HanXRQr2_Chr09g0405891 [Helianthus annuus]